MRVLFVSSGIQVKINPIIKNQGESLLRAGVDVEYYVLSGRGWKNYIRNIKPLHEKMKSGHYDLIHAHYALTAYLTGIASTGLRIPMVVSLMGNDILDHWWYPVLARMVAKIKPWKSVIVKSQEMKERVGMDYANVVPNGVNMERFHEMGKKECQKLLGWEPTKRHVLFPGANFDIRKNWPLAYSAVESLNKQIGDRFFLIGGCTKIELHDMDGVKNEVTPIWYNAADAVVLPSYYEGSPNAVKEAMACNTPIVTTDMGDCRERIEGVEGCYVANTYEVEEFAELLSKALAFGEKTKGRERLLADGMADYQIAQRLFAIYKDVTRKTKKYLH